MTSPAAHRTVVAQAVAEAVKAVPGVARLSPGTQVEVATQYAGGKVIGVGLSAEVVFVHVVVDLLPVAPVAEAVRSAAATALASLGDRRRVEVVVEDLDLVDGRLPMSYRDLR